LKLSKKKSIFSTISLPKPLLLAVEKVIEEHGYWPTKTDFVRDAVLEKLEKYMK
jgi:metal-responsive CopG/Arc/MetJ family transcriptional regulator